MPHQFVIITAIEKWYLYSDNSGFTIIIECILLLLNFVLGDVVFATAN